MIFANRADAGRRLAQELQRFRERRPVILALPRGGVPVGFEIARALEVPLDIVLVRKIGVPWHPELALGAVTDGACRQVFIDPEMAAALSVTDSQVNEATERELAEIERRRTMYCGDRAPVEVAGRTAIVVDDGIATGATMRVALRAVRRRGPERLVLAVPVAPPDALSELGREADEVVCLDVEPGLGAISLSMPISIKWTIAR
jgi:putative phosphoribosyl transferase